MISPRLYLTSHVLDRVTRRSARLQAGLTRLFGRPTLQELSQISPVFLDAAAMTRAIVPSVDEPLLEASDAEFAEIDARLAARKEEVDLRYPANFPVQTQTARALYLLVRQVRPLMMVETGVADGYSTAVVLAAMEANGTGELHSFDIRDDVAALVDSGERWRLHLLPEKHVIHRLRREVSRLKPIDIFFHDSDHHFIHQAEEYELAVASVRPGGYLVSDDVDFSYAYRELMIRTPHPSAVLLDVVKCSAYVRLS